MSSRDTTMAASTRPWTKDGIDRPWCGITQPCNVNGRNMGRMYHRVNLLVHLLCDSTKGSKLRTGRCRRVDPYLPPSLPLLLSISSSTSSSWRVNNTVVCDTAYNKGHASTQGPPGCGLEGSRVAIRHKEWKNRNIGSHSMRAAMPQSKMTYDTYGSGKGWVGELYVKVTARTLAHWTVQRHGASACPLKKLV